MTLNEFQKLKKLFVSKVGGHFVFLPEDNKKLKRLYEDAEQSPDSYIREWVSKSKYYDSDPLKTWGLR